MLSINDNLVTFFIRMKIDGNKISALDFSDFIDYIEMESTVVSFFTDDKGGNFLYAGYKTPLYGEANNSYIGRDDTSFEIDSMNKIMMLGKKEVNDNLTIANFIIWGKLENRFSLITTLNQFIVGQEYAIRKKIMLNKEDQAMN